MIPKSQQRQTAVGAIVFFIVLGVGLIVGGIVFYNMHAANRTHEWLEHTGTRVSAKCVANFYGKRHCHEYEFRVGNVTYHGFGSIKYLQPSNNEDVFYDAANPNINRLANAEAPYDLRTIYFTLIATLVIGLFVTFFVEPLASRMMRKKT
jgi:hypothetical protein